MSWVAETGDHEGCAATLVSGGRRVVGYRGAEMELDDGTWVPEGERRGGRAGVAAGGGHRCRSSA